MIIRKLKEVLALTTKKEEEVICKIDEDVVDCKEMDTPPYIGVPAPPYLKEDPWFPSPVLSEKQQDYMERETELKIKEEEQRQESGEESEDIHQRMYEIATQNSPTTVQLNPPGGSENVWMSGTGMAQFNHE